MNLSQKAPYSARKVVNLVHGELLLALLICATKATRLVRSESRIADGVNVTPLNKYPMVVNIFFDGKPEYPGTILNKYYVLSTADCAINVKANLQDVQVVAGVNRVGDPDSRYIQKVPVKSATWHVRYSDPRKGSAANNIGVIRLQNPLVWNDHVAPTNLPAPGWDILSHEKINATAVGWGLGRNDSFPFAPTRPLQEIDLPFLTTEECQRIWYDKFVEDTQFCIEAVGGAGACYEDQGAPAFIYHEEEGKHIQIGIMSLSVKGCGTERELMPSTWTKVSKYIHWINEAIRECNVPRMI